MDITLSILVFISVFLVSEVARANGNEAVLVDTRTATSDLGWTTAQDSNWVEHTTLDGDGNERRVVQVCAIRDQNQNNWLRTHFIEVESAKRIYIEIEFSIRACEDVANVKTCKETFNLYYYESDRDSATSTFPPWREGPYIKIDTIAADKRFLPGSVDTNFETRDIGPITKKGIYLAIQDTGACMAIMHVRVYYKYCPPHKQNLATFQRTIAGAEMTSLVAGEGTCVTNAVSENRRPKLYCNGEGNWMVPSGTCMCSPGFEPDTHLTKCKPCSLKQFKNHVGNQMCKRCPSYSSSMDTGSTICACSHHYYRADNDDPTKECTKPPSKPTSLVSTVNNTSVTLSWKQPSDDGGRNDVSFRLSCLQCSTGFENCKPCPRSVEFQPSQSKLASTAATVRRLSAYSYYVLRVYAVNGVTDKALASGEDDDRFLEARVETSQAAPSPVVGVRTDTNGITPSSILVIWDQPQMTNGEIIDYEVTVQKFRQSSDSESFGYVDPDSVEPTRINSTTNQHMKIANLTPGTAYIIMVRARTTAGYGKFSVPIKAETSGEHPTQPGDGSLVDGDRTLQLVVAVGCGILIVILVIVIILFCTRRKRFGKGKKLDMEKQPMFSKEIPGHKTYVDPTTYEDPHRAVRDFTKEIEGSTIKIEQVIGGGEFGDVCRGRLRQAGNPEQDVAIKTLKTGYTTQQKLDFLGEASIMGQFDHPNVIRLEGVVTRTRPLMIVTEFMENGSLDTFLRNHDGELTVLQMVGMLRHIAEGMRYLCEMGYVHRDLAARNILVDDRLVCKVSDFGLSRVLEDDADASYITRGGKIPIRWTAPEAITFRKFTSASDVWSFGIVMWEVMSYGERPYWGMSNQDVIQAVGSGYRLPAPMDCPHAQHQLMLDCWKKDRNQRPKFVQIVSSLDRMIKEPALLKVTNDSTAARKPKTPQIQHGRGSDTLTTPTTESTNTTSSNRTTPNDDLTGQEETPLVRKSNDNSPNGTGPVLYKRGEDVLISPTSGHSTPTKTTPTTSPASLGGWLDELSLGQYKDTFMKNGCASLEQVLQLNASDLKRMGIQTPAHQERILGSIISLRENSNYNVYGHRNKNYYQHRAKNYEADAPPKYEESCRNGRIPNGIPV
ncbi:ephrin type-B receptor 3-like [Styela clava]